MKKKSKNIWRNRTVKNEVLLDENKQWNENWRCEKRGRRLECNLKIGVSEKDEKLRLRIKRQW